MPPGRLPSPPRPPNAESLPSAAAVAVVVVWMLSAQFGSSVALSTNAAESTCVQQEPHLARGSRVVDAFEFHADEVDVQRLREIHIRHSLRASRHSFELI